MPSSACQSVVALWMKSIPELAKSHSRSAMAVGWLIQKGLMTVRAAISHAPSSRSSNSTRHATSCTVAPFLRFGFSAADGPDSAMTVIVAIANDEKKKHGALPDHRSRVRAFRTNHSSHRPVFKP
jgi:hypothetical protein